MVDALSMEDFIVLGIYFVIVIGVGLWSTFLPNRGSTTGYFLAGKSMHWIPVGASIYASNIGAPIFVGIAGTAAASGIAVTIYEWHAVFFLIALGWLFDPVYIACGAFTMPEYLYKRFGGKRLRMYCSIFSLIGYTFFNISAEIYTGALFLQRVLNWNLYLCVILILAVTAAFTLIGGLAAVIYTDTLQSVVLVISATILTAIGLAKVGGWEAMTEKYMQSASNNTLLNQSYFECGMPRKDAMHMLRDPVLGDLPWTGALTGLSLLGMYNWCQDQILVQRTLSAKNLVHAKAGSLFGAVLKMTGLLLFVVPGMISRILFPDEIACSDPDTCQSICGVRGGCSNIAYPLMVVRILPAGLRGLMLASLLAGLMSSLTSILNSATSVMTMDIWRQFRKHASQAELMIVGRITVLILVVISILWLPILNNLQGGGGMFWFYLQSIRSYFVPPLCVLFLLALFWKRMTEQGAFWGLMLSFAVGVTWMALNFAYPEPSCGSRDVDNRPGILKIVGFLHFAAILAILSTIFMVVISLFTEPIPDKKLHRVTWWTRNDEEEPDASSGDDDEDENKITDGYVPSESPKSVQYTRSELFAKRCKGWLCGQLNDQEKHMSREEKKQLRDKMTSIKENSKHRTILNFSAIAVALLTTFLIGYFN